MEGLFSFPFIFRLLASAGIGFLVLLFSLFAVSGLIHTGVEQSSYSFNSNLTHAGTRPLISSSNSSLNHRAAGYSTSSFNIRKAWQTTKKILSFLNKNPWLFIPISIVAIVLGEVFSFLAEFFFLHPFFKTPSIPIGIRINEKYIERVNPKCSWSFLEKFLFSGIPSDASKKNSITWETYKSFKVDKLLMLREIHYNLSRLLLSFTLILFFVFISYFNIAFPFIHLSLILLTLLYITLRFKPCLFLILFTLYLPIFFILMILVKYKFKLNRILVSFLTHNSNFLKFKSLKLFSLKILQEFFVNFLYRLNHFKLFTLIVLQLLFIIFLFLSLHHRYFANRLLKIIEEKNQNK